MSQYENISHKITQSNGMCKYMINSVDRNGCSLTKNDIQISSTNATLTNFKDRKSLNGTKLNDLENTHDNLTDIKTSINGHGKKQIHLNGTSTTVEHESTVGTIHDIPSQRPSHFNTPLLTNRPNGDCQKSISTTTTTTNSSLASSTSIATTTTTTTTSLVTSSQQPPSHPFGCQWLECHHHDHFNSSLDLANHVREEHIRPMVDNAFFVCLWHNCKVYNRPSSSHNWLLKHIHSHTGNRPFQCVIDGCVMTFATRNGLARHVPSHFKVERQKRGCIDDVILNQIDSPQSVVNGSPVAEKRSRSSHHLQNRKATVSRQLSRKDDGFDHKTMDSIKQRLTQHEVSQSMTSSGLAIKLNAQPIGRRVLANGKQDVLINWRPNILLPTSWISLTQYENSQKPFLYKSKDLPTNTQHELYTKFYQRFSHHRCRKRK